MEKKRPHYDLRLIKEAFSDIENLGPMTGTARNGVRALGFSDEDIVNVVQSLRAREFYKSMTSHLDHTIWQDVYCPKYQSVQLYLKFSRDEEDNAYLLISFKERE